jgi:hypothetical protein
MYMVAPWLPASVRSLPVSSGSSLRVTMAPSKVCTGGRAPVVGRSSPDGAPASCVRQ